MQVLDAYTPPLACGSPGPLGGPLGGTAHGPATAGGHFPSGGLPGMPGTGPRQQQQGDEGPGDGPGLPSGLPLLVALSLTTCKATLRLLNVTGMPTNSTYDGCDK